MSDTPEPDAVSEMLDFKVDLDFARKLERERDEARDRILKLTDHGLDLMDSNRELKRKCRKAIAALREAIQFRDKTLSGYDLEEWMEAAGLKEGGK